MQYASEFPTLVSCCPTCLGDAAVSESFVLLKLLSHISLSKPTELIVLFTFGVKHASVWVRSGLPLLAEQTLSYLPRNSQTHGYFLSWDKCDWVAKIHGGLYSCQATLCISMLLQQQQKKNERNWIPSPIPTTHNHLRQISIWLLERKQGHVFKGTQLTCWYIY